VANRQRLTALRQGENNMTLSKRMVLLCSLISSVITNVSANERNGFEKEKLSYTRYEYKVNNSFLSDETTLLIEKKLLLERSLYNGLQSYEYKKQGFLALGRYYPNDKAKVNVSKRCDYEDPDSPICGHEALLDVDMENGTVSRVGSNKKFPEFSHNGLRFLGGDKQNYAGNGCQQNKMIRQLDVTGDGEDEVLIIAGYGSYGGDEDGRTVANNLSIYKPSSKKLIFRDYISYESYSIFDIENLRPEFLYYNIYGLNKDGEYFDVPMEAGKKDVYKYFLIDMEALDKKTKKRLFVWGKQYVSRKKSEVGTDFKEVSENFKIYDYNNSEVVFMESSLAGSEANTIINKHQLEWAEGYPNYSLCGLGSRGGDIVPLTLEMILEP